MEKTNTIALGLHLVPGSSDGVLTYSDSIADIEYKHLDENKPDGGFQSEINKELKEALSSEINWYEE